MNAANKIFNADNGLVDMSQEAILSGVSPCSPEDICTKYPETCSNLIVEPDPCKTPCCDTAPCCSKD